MLDQSRSRKRNHYFCMFLRTSVSYCNHGDINDILLVSNMVHYYRYDRPTSSKMSCYKIVFVFFTAFLGRPDFVQKSLFSMINDAERAIYKIMYI